MPRHPHIGRLIAVLTAVAAVAAAFAGLLPAGPGAAAAADQQWKPVLQADGWYVLTARHSGKCLYVASASAADGALLQQYTCNGTAAQPFRLTPSG
ncbi:RICIN domain-containing protein [Actinacidiphila glaucinigra]|uniref:RICIN domain-containing protein n=1 Tax=Actinacidiphila glaucinigra TaxID=235986 RepID=UPI0037883E8F